MSDIRVEKLAQLIVEYSVAVRRGDRVFIKGGSLAEPLLKEIYTRVLMAGGHPLLMASLPGIDELFYRHASEEQLEHVPKPVELIAETYDVRITIIADANTRALSAVDPNKLVMQQRAQTGLMKTFMRRSAAGELRWTVAPFPTNAYAQDAEMSLTEYEDFVYQACMPDISDPVGYWQRVSARQYKLVEWLKGRKQVRVKGPSTELSFSIDGRNFQNCDGHFNIPDGEVFTGPVETSVEGTVLFSYPLYEGREVTACDCGSSTAKWSRRRRIRMRRSSMLLLTPTTVPDTSGIRHRNKRGNQPFHERYCLTKKSAAAFTALGAAYPETGGKNDPPSLGHDL